MAEAKQKRVIVKIPNVGNVAFPKTMTPAEIAQQAKVIHTKMGAPVGFSGIVLPNPRGIRPHLDTDRLSQQDVNSYLQEIPSIVKKSPVTHHQEPFSTTNPPGGTGGVVPGPLREF